MIAYVGIKPCGCVVAITTGNVEYMARDIGNYLKGGYKVECVDIEEGKRRLKKCECATTKGDKL